MDRNGEKYTALMKDMANVHPIGRVGESEECVNAIAFLAHENAGFVTVILPVQQFYTVTSSSEIIK